MSINVSQAQQIIADGNVDVLISSAKSLGESISRQLTTSQIRNIFGEVRRIEMNWNSAPSSSYRQVILLQPKLAYQAARERGKGVEVLSSALMPCLEQIQTAPKDQRQLYFSRFVDFFEAILAYHKAAGGN